MIPWSALSPAHQRFVSEYLTDYDAMRAGRVAGFTPQQVHVLLVDPVLNAVIAAEQHRMADMARIRAEDIVDELRALAFTRITDVAAWDANGFIPFDSHQLQPHHAAAIAEVSHSVTQHGEKWSIKMHNKDASIDKLMRFLGMYAADSKTLNVPQMQGVIAMPLTKAPLLPATREEEGDDA